MSKKINKQSAKALKRAMKKVMLTPEQVHQAWELLKTEGLDAALAHVEDANERIELKPPVPCQIWGEEQIDKKALDQMQAATQLPVAVVGALMPDAHLGYGLPIGGVLATENAVIPYAVGVDIACRMRITLFDVTEKALKKDNHLLKQSLLDETRFGAGAAFKSGNRSDHAVLDHPDWEATDLLRGLYRTAEKQLGTSGGGNHFVEWGLFTVEDAQPDLNITEPGTYLALLSHSGSRGVGYQIANHYSNLAMKYRAGLPKSVKHLAWFDMDSDMGREYWLSMQLAGAFAAANHEVIHERITRATGYRVLGSVENHHNFAWKEEVDGKEVIVHRKGATPAGTGVYGIIPGSMGDPGFVVRGKGSEAAINSASHGAGRKMSRREAKKTIRRGQLLTMLRERQVELLGGGLDESPHAYKSIHDVLAAQDDLVTVVGKFEPRIVRMADD